MNEIEVHVAELEQFAKQQALKPLRVSKTDDELQRKQVNWETVVFQLHDDGTGALPIVRHIIVNDSKAATYKLGLLRSVTLIAETLPGLVLRRSDTEVVLHAYLEWGEQCCDYLNGMFAFAVFDGRDGHFLLVRDRLGPRDPAGRFARAVQAHRARRAGAGLPHAGR